MVKLFPLVLLIALSVNVLAAPLRSPRGQQPAVVQVDEKKVKSLIEDLKDAMDEANLNDSASKDKFTIKKANLESFTLARTLNLGEVQSVNEIEIPWKKIASIGLESGTTGETHFVNLQFTEKLDYVFAAGSSLVPATPKRGQEDHTVIGFKKRKDARAVKDTIKKILDELGVKYTEKEDGS